MENSHNRSQYHGCLKSWLRNDIQRLLHKMVIDDYLKEELIFYRDIPQAYLRIGHKIETLMNKGEKVMFPITTTDNSATISNPIASIENNNKKNDNNKITDKATTSKGAGGESSSKPETLVVDVETQKLLRELKDKCHNDLLDACRNLAVQRNVTMVSIMNMQAIKAMSEKMPESEQEMLSIPHVTKANFEKFGQELLQITQQYSAEKLCILLDMQESQESKKKHSNTMDNDSDADSSNWAQLARSNNRSSTSMGNNSSGGVKRKGSWRSLNPHIKK